MINIVKRWFIGFSVMAFGFSAVAALPVTAVSAACNANFLTFPAWHAGLEKNGDCSLKPPKSGGNKGEGISRFVWRIVLNVIEIMLQAVAYVAAGFIIYGGFKYLISTGLPDQTSAARKTIMNAVIGLVVSFLSVVVVNIVANRL